MILIKLLKNNDNIQRTADYYLSSITQSDFNKNGKKRKEKREQKRKGKREKKILPQFDHHVS